ncbi:MAG: hypothetical protein COB36_12340 [Alphaproteobacteria bacterium]|nr:MAG: hypothetical protein COB36_12340 [Alphaproteobacteria bacterium]
MWVWFLIACGLTLVVNVKLAIVFALQVITMQVIKYIDPPNIQLFFLSCHSIWAFVCFKVDEKVGAFFLAVVSIVYIVYVLGYIPQQPKVIAAEILFVLGLAFGGVYGNGSGILARDYVSKHSHRHHNSVFHRWRDSQASKSSDKMGSQ